MIECPMSNSTVDRNLLFGLLALQNGIITRDALVAAFSIWQLDKSRTLDEILIEQKALTPERQAQLQQMLAWHIEVHGQDAAQSLAAVSTDTSARQVLISLGDADIEASLKHVATHGAEADPHATDFRPSQSGGMKLRYQTLRPHAKGGLGEVSVALDSELNREVALKEIQARFADDQPSRERFILEAEITGGLEHPGIVPVYGLGTYSDGRPFYAMRFIKGDSLKEALQDFHRVDIKLQMSPGERQFQLRKLLGRFIDVCNAIEYAHSRGVLHRDLKPGNIMLGKYGETLVVDWGLAKSVGRKEVGHSAEVTLQPSSPLSSSGMTRQGSALGTPAYISPEQATGRLDIIGPPSDIYSLGATLYHLLTGHPPIEDKDVAAVLRRAQKGDFPRPRQRDASIPRALEAICLKAMALHPEDRYPSARKLADDIEHWLADEPVTAAKESLSDRLGRLGRKHQGYVRAGLAGLLVVTIVSLTAALLIDIERRKSKQLALEKSELAIQKSNLAAEKGVLADKNAKLATEQTKLAHDERTARGLADGRAISLRRALARSLLDRGVIEDREGFGDESIAELRRAWAMTSNDDPLALAYRRIIFDRMNQGSKERLAPFRFSGPMRSVAFSPDGTRLVTGSGASGKSPTKNSPGRLQLWDAQTGAALDSIPVEGTEDVACVAFSPDGTRILAGSGNVARLWNVQTGKPIGNPMLHDVTVSSVAFSADGSRIASGCSDFFKGSDHSIRMWDGQTGMAIGEPIHYSGGVRCVAFSPDGNQVVTGSNDKTLRIWNMATGAQMGGPCIHLNAVLCVAYSPDGTRILSCDGAGTHLWDAQTHIPIHKPLEQTAALCVAFSPDGTRVVTGGEDKTVQLWDAQSGTSLGEPLNHLEPVTCVAFSPDGTCIASGGKDHTLRLWDATCSASLRDRMQHFDAVTCVAYSPDGMRIVSGSEDRTVRVWDARTGAELGEPVRHAEPVKCVAFSSNGTQVISAGKNGILQRSETPNGTVIGEPFKIAANCLAFNSNGTRVASVDFRGNWRLWDIQSQTTICEMQRAGNEMLASEVRCLAISPDHSRLVSGSNDKTLTLWDAKTGSPLGESMKHSGSVICVAFSPDGTRIVSGSEDKTLRLWDAQTFAAVCLPMLHSGTVSCVAFSPDGTRVASGSVDKTLRLWDAKTGCPLGLPMQHAGTVRSVAFSPNGAYVLSGSDDHGLRVWSASSSALDELPRLTVDRMFTLWSAVDADSEGKLRNLPAEESYSLAQRLGKEQPFLKFISQQNEERERRLPVFHQQEASTAETSNNAFAAQFHLQQILKRLPAGDDRQRAIFNARLTRATLQLEKQEDAQHLLRRSIEIDELRVADNPASLQFQSDLALSCYKMGDLLVAMGQIKAALPYYLRHQKFWSQLSETLTCHAATERTLAASYDKVGSLLQQVGEAEQALEQYRRQLEVNLKIDVGNLVVTGYGERWRQPYSLFRIGDSLVQLGRFQEGLESYQKSVTLTQTLAGKYPGDEWCQKQLLLTYDRMGDARLRQEQPTGALEYYQQGLILRRKRAESVPFDFQAQRDLQVCLQKLGKVELERFQFAAARRHYESGLAVLDAFTARTKRDQFAKETAELKEFIAICDAAPRMIVDLEFTLTQDKSVLPRRLEMRVQALLAYANSTQEDIPLPVRQKWSTGQMPAELLQEAIRTADKYRVLEPAESRNLYNAGCCFSLCLKALTKIDVPDKDQLKSRLQTKALEALKAAATAGWNEADFTAQDTDLEPLRDLPEFKLLLEQVRAKRKTP
ncbi:MAG: Serine/threonine protein kinaserelated protein [Planctomycetaceae bacterium]|nr:Serine/threonine protein kinaserelated protein [Planctomycetaceae bacterium]